MRRLFVAGLLLLASHSVLAHHSFDAEYDRNKPIKFEGVVSKIEFFNPHARIYIDVTDSSGKVVTWNLELASPSALVRNGWKPNSVKVGEKVYVEGFDGRGTNTYHGNASVIKTADGRSLFSSAAGQ